MIEKTTQSVSNLAYHAHIYYDPSNTRAGAEQLCAALGERFPAEIDGFRDTPVGPHPVSNVLVIFSSPTSSSMWCLSDAEPRRARHTGPPLTTDAVEEHSSYAIWLGNPVALKLHTLLRGRGGRLPSGVRA